MEKEREGRAGRKGLSPKKGSSPRKGRKKRASWTNGQTSFLVSMMKEYADTAKFRGQNGWTKEGWNNMAARLNAKYDGANFTVQQLKDREQRLKKDHSSVKSVVSKSGFGWNPEKGVPTALDEKWEELPPALQKWRYKSFPYYDDLYEIYEGKIAEGKNCKRTTDKYTEDYNSPSFSQVGSLYDQVVNASMESPNANATKETMQPDMEDSLYNDGMDDSQYTGFPLHGEIPCSDERDQTRRESPPRERPYLGKTTSEGGDKSKAKKSKDAMLESLVAIRKEELENYKEMKSKQIESYREIKFAQMEKNDPNNDPYSMARCIIKLEQLNFLTPADMVKVISYLTKDRLHRETFMTVQYAILVELLKEVVGHEF